MSARSSPTRGFTGAIHALVVGVGISLVAGNAAACSCREKSREVLFRSAEAVFFARVTETRLVDTHVEARFEVIESFKQGRRKIDTVIDPVCAIGNCSICLIAGHDYIFFVNDRGYVGMCTGSSGVNQNSRELPKVLDELRGYGARR